MKKVISLVLVVLFLFTGLCCGCKNNKDITFYDENITRNDENCDNYTWLYSKFPAEGKWIPVNFSTFTIGSIDGVKVAGNYQPLKTIDDIKTELFNYVLFYDYSLINYIVEKQKIENLFLTIGGGDISFLAENEDTIKNAIFNCFKDEILNSRINSDNLSLFLKSNLYNNVFQDYRISNELYMYINLINIFCTSIEFYEKENTEKRTSIELNINNTLYWDGYSTNYNDNEGVTCYFDPLAVKDTTGDYKGYYSSLPGIMTQGNCKSIDNTYNFNMPIDTTNKENNNFWYINIKLDNHSGHTGQASYCPHIDFTESNYVNGLNRMVYIKNYDILIAFNDSYGKDNLVVYYKRVN